MKSFSVKQGSDKETIVVCENIQAVLAAYNPTSIVEIHPKVMVLRPENRHYQLMYEALDLELHYQQHGWFMHKGERISTEDPDKHRAKSILAQYRLNAIKVAKGEVGPLTPAQFYSE